MQKVLKSTQFEFRINTAFEEVIHSCSRMERKGQDGTWIGNEIIAAYTHLHRLGFAHAAEAWHNGKLSGGLYGIKMGNIFFGESMFSTMANASKFAFIQWVRALEQQGVKLIDCQVHTAHLESLGARMIPRKQFMKLLSVNILHHVVDP